MRQWQVQEAKNKLSEVIGRARSEGPQIITRHGREVVVMISIEEYRAALQPEGSLSTFLARSPLAGVDLDLSRDESAPRPPLDQ